MINIGENIWEFKVNKPLFSHTRLLFILDCINLILDLAVSIKYCLEIII